MEKQHWGSLPSYANAEGSDTQQFAGFKEAVKNRLEGRSSAKIQPEANSAWLMDTAQRILDELGAIELLPKLKNNKEYLSTVTDLRILAQLARYHATRIHAALNYALFKETRDGNALNDAISAEEKAIEEWRKLVAAAGDVYHYDLAMGLRSADLSGHWRDELKPLEDGLKTLRNERQSLSTEKKTPLSEHAEETPPVFIHDRIHSAPALEPLTIKAVAKHPSGIKAVRVLYRPVTQFEDYQNVEMKRGAGDNYEAIIPGDQLNPKWDFMYFFEVIDATGHGRIYPDLEYETPYIVVKLKR